MKYRSSIFIPNPIEEVFDFAVDQVGANRWQFQVGVKHLTGEANAPGSTYERRSFAGRASLHTYELVEVARPFRFDARWIEGPWPFRYEYTFAAEGEGTQVSVDVDSEGEPPVEIEGRLALLRRQIAGDTPRLAAVSSTAPRLLTEIEQERAAELTAIDQARALNEAQTQLHIPHSTASRGMPLSGIAAFLIPALLIILINIGWLWSLLSGGYGGYGGMFIMFLGAAINLGLGGLGLIVLIVAAIATKGKLAAFGGGLLAGSVISFAPFL
jgi:hypothetical protein